MIFFSFCRVFQQEIDNGILYFIDNPGSDFRIAEFVLRLGFKYRFFDLDSNCSNHPFSYILWCPVLLEVLVYAFENTLFECTLMGSPPIGGMLAIHIREVVLPVGASHMGQGKLKLLALVVDDRIEIFRSNLFIKKVIEAIG